MPISANVVLGHGVKIFQPELVNLYGCTVGDETKIGAFVEIQKNAIIGKRCKISSHTFICEGVTIEDDVFVGHGVMFINDLYPRATADGRLQTETDWQVVPTRVKRGASIGSGAVILAGVTIGEGALIGAGAVVTRGCARSPNRERGSREAGARRPTEVDNGQIGKLTGRIVGIGTKDPLNTIHGLAFDCGSGWSPGIPRTEEWPACSTRLVAEGCARARTVRQHKSHSRPGGGTRLPPSNSPGPPRTR